MEKGVIWLVVFLITAKVRGDSQVANSSTYLDGAITGFDPFFMSCLKLPNPGRRSKIFQPLYTLLYSSNKTVLNSFVDEVQDINNISEISVQKVINFQQYIDYMTFSGYELSSDTNLGAPYLLYENYSSYETKKHHRDHVMFQFFKDTGGEVLFAKTDTVTHSITISPFEIPSFTPGFERALVTLHDAALNPISEIRHEIFSEFVKMYGTHFSRRTLLGSRAIFGKVFSTRAATVDEETDRRRCVLEAAREALTPCMRGCNETTHTVFAKRSAEKCGEEKYEAIVSISGLLPERNLEDWASTAKHSPNPIFHELEPMPNLFHADWFTKVHEGIQINLNWTILRQYFEEHLFDYNSRMASRGGNKSRPRGCGLNSDCRPGTRCLNEPDTEAGFSCAPNKDATTTTTTSTTTTVPTMKTLAPTTTATTTTMSPACPLAGDWIDALEGQTQTLTSHDSYGTSNYENNFSSLHIIVAPSGLRVRVGIENFTTENAHDRLFIFDGNTVLNRPMAGHSGTLSPPFPTYTSLGCTITIFFSSDGSTTYPGFSILYDAVA